MDNHDLALLYGLTAYAKNNNLYMYD